MLKGRSEKRQFGRLETNWDGRLHLGDQRVIACTVIDVSTAGARVELRKPISLPFRFHLEVPAKGLFSICELRHQFGLRIGVQFVAAGEEVRAPTGHPAGDIGNDAKVAKRMTVSDLRAIVARD